MAPAAPAQPVAVPSISKVTRAANGKSVTLQWKKLSGISGYEIVYSTKKSFASKKTVTASAAKTKLKISKLSSKKVYYVRMRAYAMRNGKKVYSGWSKIKKVKR